MKKNKNLPKMQTTRYYDYDDVRLFLKQNQNWPIEDLKIWERMCHDSGNAELSCVFLDEIANNPEDYDEQWSRVAQKMLDLGFPECMQYMWCW
jgi:hypothetical protein